MIRKLKALGPALMAMCALGAVAASAASAQVSGDVTSDGPVTLTVTETGEGTNFLKAFGIKLACEGSTYTGHKWEETPHEYLPEHFDTVTVTPHYKQENCLTAGTFPTTIDMNGCDYVLHLGNTTNAELDEYAVTLDLVCPEGQDVTITVFWDGAKPHDTENNFCTIHIKPQTGLTGAELRDTTNGHLDLTGTVTGIHSVSTDFGTHPLFCPGPAGTHASPGEQTINNGELSLDLTVKGHNEAGEPTNLTISENE